MTTVFDFVLVSAIGYLAWRAMADRDLFRAVVQFIAMGMLVAVAWVRLRAPDVALAEAAVGSGLTGAMMLSALARMRRREESQGMKRGMASVEQGRGTARGWLWAAGGWGLFGLLALVVAELPAGRGLTAESLANLPASGVENPVTAVLLNYRGFDTLLEVGVLLLALVGVWSLYGVNMGALEQEAPVMLASLMRVVLPVLAVVSGYLLWIGAFAPGGAFQGGALIGGGIVLGVLGGLGARWLRRERWLRAGLVAGVCVFASVAGITTWMTGGLLQYPAGSAGIWILAIESAAMISIGLTLGLMFLGGRPEREEA